MRDHIMTMHRSAPFTLNSKTLLTESAGRVVNGHYTDTGYSWLINPLITYALLKSADAALFFPNMPTNKQVKNVGYQPCNFTAIIQTISQYFINGTCNVHLHDILHLPSHNFLYYSPNLQNQVLTRLEYCHKPLSDQLLMFAFEKFTAEREVHMNTLRPRTIPLFADLSQPTRAVSTPVRQNPSNTTS